ncbi:MAG: holin [Polynucleobacter sp.]|nr:holin [Polynucleobacter sp.]
MKVEDTAVFFSNRTTEAGAITGVVGWMASVNWIGWAGVFIALLGLFANLYYQRRRDRREQAESEARLESMRRQRDS